MPTASIFYPQACNYGCLSYIHGKVPSLNRSHPTPKYRGGPHRHSSSEVRKRIIEASSISYSRPIRFQRRIDTGLIVLKNMHINRFVKKDSRAIENSDWFHFRFRAGRVAIDALMTRISVLGEPKSIRKITTHALVPLLNMKNGEQLTFIQLFQGLRNWKDNICQQKETCWPDGLAHVASGY